MKKKYEIKGMHCRSCEILLEKNISQIGGVRSVEAHHKKGFIEVEFFEEEINEAAIVKAVKDSGYSLGKKEDASWLAHDSETWFEILVGVFALMILFIVGKLTGVFENIGTTFGSAPTYPIVFVIGLTAGVSTCMALVGGLVASFSAAYAEKHQYATRWQRFKPNLFFNTGRLLSYAVFGGIIGVLGSVVKLSTGFTGFLVMIAGAVMLYLGLKLTGLSPKLSNVSFSLPKKFGRVVGIKNQSGDYSHQEAFIGGALTFFLPCGFTQAMQIYAMTTGSFMSGAVIMVLFALGTMPGLLGIGVLTSVLQGRTGRMFFRFIGIAVLVLGLFNFMNMNGYNLTGITFNIPSSDNNSAGVAVSVPPVPIENNEQVVNMIQTANGYQPSSFTVKKGIPVKWVIDSQNAYTCAASIRMPDYNIGQFLEAGTNIIRFTPTKTGTVRFTCSMGMFSGSFNVVE